MRDEAVGAERLEQSKRQVKWHQDRTCSRVSADAAVEQVLGVAKCPHLQETPRTAEYAEFLSLQDRAESRRVQSAHGELMRLGELSAEVFCPGRFVQVAACSTCSLNVLST